ncbi:hypothetical protein HWV62_35089 [Athelia sp. TMB]|nr:hypothetical protein HWV62_35089 [Athelia sp. TMB]
MLTSEHRNYLKTPHASVNLLSILERLRTFPTAPSDINKWWVPELGAKPPSKSKKSPAPGESDSEDEEPKEGEDDWRTFFDEPNEDAAKAKGKAVPRLHKMNLHQSLHAIPSHRAVFTRAWLGLLPHLSPSSGQQDTRRKEQEKLAVRALTTLHSTVLPHLTRPILVMDWVGGCVDAGGVVGLLALNALFILMTQYNL